MKEGKIKFGLSQYTKPTPKNAKVIGDALLYVGQTGAGLSIVQGNATLSIVCIIAASAGKALTSLFGEDPERTIEKAKGRLSAKERKKIFKNPEAKLKEIATEVFD